MTTGPKDYSGRQAPAQSSSSSPFASSMIRLPGSATSFLVEAEDATTTRTRATTTTTIVVQQLLSERRQNASTAARRVIATMITQEEGAEEQGARTIPPRRPLLMHLRQEHALHIIDQALEVLFFDDEEGSNEEFRYKGRVQE